MSQMVALGELGKWIGGGTPSKANPAFWTDGTIPWVSPKDMKTERIRDAQDRITEEAAKNSATTRVKQGAILVVARSGILKHSLPVAVTDIDVTINQDMKAVELKPGFLPDYVAWAIRTHARDILHQCTKSGTTVQNLDFPSFLRFQVPIVPLDKQRRIVAEIEEQLSRLEAGVAALKRVQANLKRYRASILSAAIQGELGDTVGTDGWTQSEIRALAAKEPNSITDGPFGSKLKTEHYTSTGPRVIRLQNIGDGFFIDEKAHISKDHFASLSKHRVFPGDLVIAGLGETLPRACLIPDDIGPAIVKADCIRFKAGGSVLPKFLMYALNADKTRRATKERMHGVGRPRLNLGEIKSIIVPVPPLARQREIVEEVDRRLPVVEELETQVRVDLARADRTRQAVLSASFSLG